VVRPSQLGAGGRQIYNRLFQEAYGVPFEMVAMLRKEALPISELSRRLKMSRRTVFRYLVALEGLGCDLVLNDAGYHIAKCGKTLQRLVG
jgi:biotin operon repressor